MEKKVKTWIEIEIFVITYLAYYVKMDLQNLVFTDHGMEDYRVSPH